MKTAIFGLILISTAALAEGEIHCAKLVKYETNAGHRIVGLENGRLDLTLSKKEARMSYEGTAVMNLFNSRDGSYGDYESRYSQPYIPVPKHEKVSEGVYQDYISGAACLGFPGWMCGSETRTYHYEMSQILVKDETVTFNKYRIVRSGTEGKISKKEAFAQFKKDGPDHSYTFGECR